MECRLCLNPVLKQASISIRDNPDTLVQRIWFCCRLQINKDDKFPDRICFSCENTLDLLKSFKTTCKFRQKLRPAKSSGIKIEEILLDDLNWDESSTDVLENNSNADDVCKQNALEDSDSNEEKTITFSRNSPVDGRASLCDLSRGIIDSDNSSAYECDVCFKTFVSKSEFATHSKTHDDTLQYCEFRLTSIPTSLMHHKIRSKLNTYLCDICLKPFTHKYSLAKHIKSHDKAFKCETCLKSFSHELVLEKHIKSSHGVYKFKCNICQKEFTRKYNLELHITRHNKAFKCGFCFKSFSLQSTLENHMKFHIKVNRHKCVICLKLFSLKSSLKKHMDTFDHTNFNARQNQFKCSICSKSFKLSIELKLHMKKHENNSPHYKVIRSVVKTEIFSSNLANTEKFSSNMANTKAFSSNLANTENFSSNLANTKPYIYPARVYTCDICFKTFPLKSEHGTHKMTHWNGLYKCDICSILFGSPPELEDHRKTHGNKLPQSSRDNTYT